MIDLEKITPLEFCILVMWMHGWTISKIHLSIAKRHGKTANGVRGIINKLEKRRQELTREERQAVLDGWRAARIDDGMLPEAYFKATSLASDQKGKKVVAETTKIAKAVESPPDPKTRAGRAELKRRKKEEKRRQALAEEEAKRRSEGLAPRGMMAEPLAFLAGSGALDEPGEKKGGIRALSRDRRREAGERLRAMLVSAYGSGLKTANYEAVGGGGGTGVAIHAAVAENLANIAQIKAMLSPEEFERLDKMLRLDLFVWQMQGELSEEPLIDEIRRLLDVLSVHFDFISLRYFRERWGATIEMPNVGRSNSRQANRAARDMLEKAQRQVR
ncbi:hypothetical protein [Shinella zoogloeoides]|uniref:hypothetical protein n=1 Tax=Shinella zoogloeoides TaxID=352475 RepID=UPI00299EA150|nr:hypothetical protein [Shinella zoogloeoides]WPE19896.1 hypothetical protein ShzoTeo12_10720 [Shinella zoogloeoides]